jgi:hypothetical protein
LRRQAVTVGAKNTLEVLARAYNNNMIDEHTAVLAELLHKDATAELHREFLEYWSNKDGFAFLISLLLECPDNKARSCIATLMKYVLVTLKMKEKDYLQELEDYEFEGDDGKKVTLQRHKSVSARFIVRMLDLLNTKVAKNWSHFEQFLEILHVYAVADVADVQAVVFGLGKENAATAGPKTYDTKTTAARVGLDFFAKLEFVNKACDFMLGKKSPLCKAGETRPEMGSYYAAPDFSGVIKLLSLLIADEDVLEKHPLGEAERDLILHPSLLKTMLGSATASKPFGVCLAKMCKEDEVLSKKVAKVFLTSIEQAAHDVVSAYLKALRPFLCTNDSLKQKKLEWIFGVPALLHGRCYGEQRPKYGLELVDKIGDECLQFNSPVLFAATDEALVAQIIKCKGRFDQQCIACLKELLGLMAKDQDVAKFVWNLPPYNYQSARFIDWFRPYLQEQIAEQNRMTTGIGTYYKAKMDMLNKAMAHLEALEPLFKELEGQQMERMAKCMADGGSGEFKDIAEHWIGATCKEVIRHFPPQLVIGRPVAAEREIFALDAESHVRVRIFEIDHEYAYSAPTGLFNLAAPHVARRTNHYSIETYEQHAKSTMKQRPIQEQADAEDLSEPQQMSQEDRPEAQTAASTAVEEWTSPARQWATSSRVAPVLMRVLLTNTSETDDVKVWYRLGTKNPAGANVTLPLSSRKAYISAKSQTVIENLVKIDPTKDYFFSDMSDIVVELEATAKEEEAAAARGTQKRVHYPPQHDALGGSGAADDDDDERDDDEAYADYQDNPHHTGYDGSEHQAELGHLLQLRP